MSEQPAATQRIARPGYIALAAVLALAAGLRLIAFTWGLPDATHMFSYHPDEFHSLHGAFSLAMGDPNPHFFNYGSLYLYLVALAAMVGSPAIFTSISQAAPGGPELPAAIRAWTLDARVVTLLLSLATVYVVYLTARRIWGQWPGVLAAGALAVMPLHVVHSHYATVDVPGAFFVALALYFAVRTAEEPTARSLVWAGIAAGLAASVKYSGGLVIVAPLLAWLMTTDRRRWQAPVIIIACAAAAFALTSPYTLLDWSDAWRDISFEMAHMRAGDDPAAIARDPNGWWFHLQQLHLALTWPLLAAGVWGAVAGLRCYWRQVLPLLVFTLLAFAVIGSAQVRYARYEMVLLPPLAVLVGWAVQSVRPGVVRVVAWLLTATGLVAAAWVTVLWLAIMGHVGFMDPRTSVMERIEDMVPQDDSIGLVSEPWFHQPPVDYCNGGPGLRSSPVWGAYRRPVRELVITGLDPGALGEALPRVLIFTDFDLAAPIEQREAFWTGLLDDLYGSGVMWEGYLGFGTWWTRAVTWEPAHDWRYVCPMIYYRTLRPSSGSVVPQLPPGQMMGMPDVN